MSDHAETYKVLETDAVNWLEMAEGLRMSAQLSWDALWTVQGQPPAEVRQDKMAYAASFMLLTAFALENICRGIATITEETGWRFLADARGGHILSKDVPKFIKITEKERDLLERLETYSVWAGRYLIPKDSKAYVSACERRSRTIRNTDLAMVDQLFARLKAQFESVREEADERATGKYDK